MVISSKERLIQYIRWWFKRSRQSSGWKNSLIIIGLCIGLFWIASLYEAPKSRYDKTPYAHYPIKLKCDVDRILDGDTIIALCPISLESTEKSLRSVRLWGMDAPESGQKYWGDFATQTLIDLIDHHTSITIEIMAQDRYQRMIGKLYVDDLDLGLEMVSRGAAVVYHRYNKDQDYINAEKKAKIARLGIWKTSGAQQNPERWRRFNP